MCIGVKVSDPLELELQTVVSCHVGYWELNPYPLEEQSMQLTTEPSSLQSSATRFYLVSCALTWPGQKAPVSSNFQSNGNVFHAQNLI